jgi:hypothetical protein
MLDVEDRRLLGLIPKLKIKPDEEREVSIKGLYPITTQVKEKFSQDFSGIGRTVKLTLMVIDEACGKLDEEDLKIMARNIGWYETAVASVIMWKHAIPDKLRVHMSKIGLFKIPIKEWKERLADYLIDVRRYNGVGLEDYYEDAEAAAMVRKLPNLSGRDLQQTDFELEMLNMHPKNTAKMMPKGKKLSCRVWFTKLFNKIDEVIKTVFPEIVQKANLRNMEQWWRTRRAWVPNGSSSARARLNQYKKLDERLRTSDRPGKKAVAETYDISDLERWLASKPCAFARLSTKPEPGFKRRALYASDDGSTYITSFASADIEKALSLFDMVIKQSPEDIIEWLRANEKASMNELAVWVSLDYSDFNKEHSKLALCYLNIAIAREWLKRSKHSAMGDVMVQKAYAAIWVAKSHMNSWHTNDEGQTFTRHWSGLWSGHRDTARDNTILHTVYSEIMKDLVKEKTGQTVEWYYNGKCGDDEDALHHSWLTGALYVGAHMVCGFNLNPNKQLVGKWEHEFLQRTACHRRLPLKPLPSVIATLSTGNWYKETRSYYRSSVSSMTGVLSELLVRGSKRNIACKTCLRLLKNMMVLREKSKKKTKLELKPFFDEMIKNEEWNVEYNKVNDKMVIKEGPWEGLVILHGRKTHEIDLDQIDLLSEQLGNNEIPQKATNDWISENYKWIPKDKMNIYKQTLLKEAYRSMFGNLAQKNRDQLAREVIQQRVTKIDYEGDESKYIENVDAIMWEMQKQYPYTRPITEDALIARLLIDRSLFNLINGWEGIYRYGEAKDLKHYVNMKAVVEPVKPKVAKTCLDSVLKSWLVNRKLQL